MNAARARAHTVLVQTASTGSRAAVTVATRTHDARQTSMNAVPAHVCILARVLMVPMPTLANATMKATRAQTVMLPSTSAPRAHVCTALVLMTSTAISAAVTMVLVECTAKRPSVQEVNS